MLSVKCEVWSVKEAVRSEKCEVWSVDCEVRSVKCGLWIVKCRLWSVKCEVWSVKEAVRSVKCGVWSLKFGLRRVQCAVCSVRCGVSREGHGRDRASLNYRSFMFGKLPPPACPGLCYILGAIFCFAIFWSILGDEHLLFLGGFVGWTKIAMWFSCVWWIAVKELCFFLFP